MKLDTNVQHRCDAMRLVSIGWNTWIRVARPIGFLTGRGPTAYTVVNQLGCECALYTWFGISGGA